MRENPGAFYDAVATSLGAQPFEPGTKFVRNNTRGGHRTGLCRNLTLISELKEVLLPDYVAQEALLGHLGTIGVPDSLLENRCQRVSDLGFGRDRSKAIERARKHIEIGSVSQ